MFVVSKHLGFTDFRLKLPLRGAFTLIEVLIVIGITSVLAGVGVAVVSNASESARVSKLSSDVAHYQ